MSFLEKIKLKTKEEKNVIIAVLIALIAGLFVILFNIFVAIGFVAISYIIWVWWGEFKERNRIIN